MGHRSRFPIAKMLLGLALAAIHPALGTTSRNSCRDTYKLLKFASENGPVKEVAEASVTAPPVQVETLQLQAYGSNTLEALRGGKRQFFARDLSGNVVSMDRLPSVADETGILVLQDGKGNAFIAQEIGEVTLDSSSAKAHLQPAKSYSWSSTDEPIKIAEGHGVKGPLKAAPSRIRSAKHLDCDDLVNKSKSDTRFILDSLVAGYVVNAVGLGVGEAMGAGRLSTEVGVQNVLSENIANTANTAIGASSAVLMSNSKLGVAQKLAIRTASGLLMIHAVKKPIMNSLSIEDSSSEGQGESSQSSAASRIANFDTAYMFGRTPIDLLLDEKVFRKMIPEMIRERCLAGASLLIYHSPTFLRIVERNLSTVLYFSLRKAAVGN